MQVTPLRRILASPIPNLNALVAVSNGMRAGSKALLQQNLPVLNCGCRLRQADLYSSIVVVVVVVVVSFCYYGRPM